MSTYLSGAAIEWNFLTGGTNPAVLEGRCTVAEACKTPEGFIEAICELTRLGAGTG